MSNSAARTYLREFSFAMLGYVVVLPISILLIQASPATAWWRVPVALAPVVPAAFVLVAFLRYFRRMDELQRRIQFEGLALAFGATTLLTFSYGFLENVGFPPLSWIFVAPLMIALWGLGCARAARSYR